MVNTYLKAIGFGVIAGIRSLSAPAFASGYLAEPNSRAAAFGASALRSPTVTARVIRLAAAGEIIADKLPIIPDRISPAPLAARILSGAVCGGTVYTADGRPPASGAIVGGLSAIVSAFASYHLRQLAAERTAVPDAILGLAEDAFVLALGNCLVEHPYL